MAPKRKQPSSSRHHQATDSPPKKKKTKSAATTSSTDAQDHEDSSCESDAAKGRKTIIIEHCKQSKLFKTKAEEVKNGLERGVADIRVVFNPKKPRKGRFEIRQEGGEILLSMKNMKKPFKKLKSLDIAKVISDIVEKIID